MNERKTKILAKIADNRAGADFLKSLFAAGADIAWLNTAHQGEAETKIVVDTIRSISTSMPIMIDTKGPEVRTKDIDVPFEVKKGDHLIFTGDLSYKGTNVVHVTYTNFHNEIPVGEVILYDDALIETVAVEKVKNGIKCIVNNGGMIKNKKSLNIPNVHIDLPALTEKDKGFIHFCAKNKIDYITHSFVRSKQDIADIKKITDQYPDYNPMIIAKIENREGFDNVKDILKHCEGLMVARGDLGAEVPLSELPYMQKKMVGAALEAGKYCIVATQVLESMIKNPRPTRAEVSDIGNAVLDGTCCVSMSGETAYGDYPIEATTIMGKVMKYTEEKRAELIHFTAVPTKMTPMLKMAKDMIKKAESSKAKAILAVGCDIELLRAFSALRPSVLVIAGSTNEAVVREVGLAYGVRGIFLKEATVTAMAASLKGAFKPKDVVLVVEKKGKAYAKAAKAFSAVK